MKPVSRQAIAGVTLLEMIFVVIIASIAVMAGLQFYRQRADDIMTSASAANIQRIIDAAEAYYLIHGRWPDAECTNFITNTGPGSLTALSPDYIPKIKGLLPSDPYYSVIHCPAVNQTYKIPENALLVLSYDFKTAETSGYAAAHADALANMVKSKVGTTSNYGDPAFKGLVVAYAVPPPQSAAKRNLEGFNYAGLYHQGACVPVPQCPPVTIEGVRTNTTAQLILVPVSVSGVNDTGSTNVYPISSFTAYAQGPSGEGEDPDACVGSTTTPDCTALLSDNQVTTNQYWRSCIQIVTERGDVQTTRVDDWGSEVTMAAFTRCSPNNEASGSSLTDYGN